MTYVIVVLWFSKAYGLYKVYGYNPYTLENHSTADLYYDATTQTLGSVSLPQSLYFTMQLGCIFIHPSLGCMRFLEYMGFVLAVFPLKYGFIIVQYCIHTIYMAHIHVLVYRVVQHNFRLMKQPI